MKEIDINDIIQKLKDFKRNNSLDLYQKINKFKVSIELLINKTPTGETRNSITELNILFNSILDTYETENKIKKQL